MVPFSYLCRQRGRDVRLCRRRRFSLALPKDSLGRDVVLRIGELHHCDHKYRLAMNIRRWTNLDLKPAADEWRIPK